MSDWETFSREIGTSGLLVQNTESILLPLVAAINGDRPKAESLVRQELDRVGDADDVYSKSHRDFAAKFAEKSF